MVRARRPGRSGPAAQHGRRPFQERTRSIRHTTAHSGLTPASGRPTGLRRPSAVNGMAPPGYCRGSQDLAPQRAGPPCAHSAPPSCALWMNDRMRTLRLIPPSRPRARPARHWAPALLLLCGTALAQQAAQPHHPVRPLNYSAMLPTGDTPTVPAEGAWQAANQAVAEFPRGHADIVRWEALQPAGPVTSQHTPGAAHHGGGHHGGAHAPRPSIAATTSENAAEATKERP